MNLDINVKKKLYGAIVPLTCGSEHATAFFISENTLLTARHAVIDNLFNGTTVYIHPSKTYACTVEEIGEVDVVILKCDYTSTDYLRLLSARFNEDLNLMVMGYPAELGNHRDVISLDVRNRIESSSQDCDVLVVREDNLALANYKGFSGSPVVNDSGSTIGVMTNRVSQALGYISIRGIESLLNAKGVKFSKNDQKEDFSTYGHGRSVKQVKEAIKLAGNRYSPELHVVDKILNFEFRCFLDKGNADFAQAKVQEMEDWLTDDSRSFREAAKDIISSERLHKIDDLFDLALKSDNNEERYYYKKNKSKFKDYERQKNIFGKKCIVLNGKAGCGKTHLLCYQSLVLKELANVYLTFGSQFNAEEGIMPQLCRLLKFEDDNLRSLNQKMVESGSYAVIVVDALNEGASENYWSENLPLLYSIVSECSNVKLILSARDQSDKDIFAGILSKDTTDYFHLTGFSDVNTAIAKYFRAFHINDSGNKISERYFSDFTNPLFLKIFCKVASAIGQNAVLGITRSELYLYYIMVRNRDVCRKVDEDENRQITYKFMMALANYSLNYDHCLPVPREKARIYADRICRYRLWSNNLLNVCLRENLLLPARMNKHDIQRLMFEYEQLGDFLKVAAMKNGRRSDEQIRQYMIEESKKYRTSHIDHFIEAFLSEWDDLDSILENPTFTRLFEKRLIESVKLQNVNTDKIKLWAEKHSLYNPSLLLGHIQVMNMGDVDKFNEFMLSKTMYERDIMWTVNVGPMYNTYNEEYFRGIITFDDNSPNGDIKTCLLLLWMCTCPHPQVRAIILRRVTTIFKRNTDSGLIASLIKKLHTCNDPYVLHVLYAAIYGWALLTRDKERIGGIAALIYQYHYQNRDNVPLDIVVRHWTQSLLAFSIELGNENMLTKSLPPYPTQDPYELIQVTEFDKDYFGQSHSSDLLYDSINGFSDFNRYTIGTNNSNDSRNYIREKDGVREWVKLQDMIDMINNIVHDEYRWSDELGNLFNDSYSSNRSYNKTERIGKKYQFLALYKIEALLSDHCAITDGISWYYHEIPVEAELVPTPYAWYSKQIPSIDPTLSDEPDDRVELTPVDPVAEYKEMTDEEWEADETILPFPRFVLKDQFQTEWIVLTCYDTKKITPHEYTRDLFLFINSGFIQKGELGKIEKWGSETNFYGRWMPESRGMCDFLWNEYTWAERYRRYQKEEDDYQPNGCPCKVELSYIGQLQENIEGILDTLNVESTVYAPNLDMMNTLGLYTAERGVVRTKEREEMVAANFRIGGFNGLAVKKDMLDRYLQEKGLALAYFICGEKCWHDKDYHNRGRMFDLSGCYTYENGELKCIQEIHIVANHSGKMENKSTEPLVD